MESSVTTAPLKLLRLYKSPVVNRISTFSNVTGQLDPPSLVAAYVDLRNLAPRRHDRDKKYFVDHAGETDRSASSNRLEEHLAFELWKSSGQGTRMMLPTGATLEILDYQTPLKAKQKDEGVGKVNLFGLIDDRRLTVIELKVRPARGGRGDTPLRAYLEALAYCAIVESNASEIASEASSRFNKSIDEGSPALVIMAPEDYWTGYLKHPKAGSWWPVLSGLATEIEELLRIETHFLGLRNATLVGVPELIGD
jgi:hypothetical protein